MLHTVYITHKIHSIKQYNKLYEILNNNSLNTGYKFYPNENNHVDTENNQIYQVHTTHYLQDIGFNEIVLRKQTTRKKYIRPIMAIEIFLNPKKLISDNHVKITKDKDIVPISNKFNEIIKGIDAELPEFFYWTLKRIDYATYIKTPNVKEYIKLFQKGDMPSKYFKELYNQKQKRRGQRKGSFYLYSKSAAINFYDKEQERIDNQLKYNISDDDILKSRNVLRIEIQCNKSKTDYMNYKHEFKTKEIFHYLDLDLSKDMILYYFKKCIREGNYYKLDKAKKLIDENKDLTTRAKNALKDTLDLINKCRSIYKARENFNGTKETFNNHLKQLDKLNINPVTIPERWNIKDNFLINPVNEIKNNMTNLLEEGDL